MFARLRAAIPRALIGLLSVTAAGHALADLVLYQDDDFRGRSFGTTRSVTNLGDNGFNDKASSVVIRGGSWQLCSDADFRGRCITLGPGRYPSLSSWGLNDKISSLREGDGWGGFRNNDDNRGRYDDAPRGGRWDDNSEPRVYMGSNRFGRVTYDNGCVVFYDPQGRRQDSRSDCSSRQLRRADDAMSAYRRQQGHDRYDNDRSWRDRNDRGDDGALPHIVMGRDGEGDAIYANNCTVHLNAQGRRTRSSGQCTQRQLDGAEQAMAAQMRERVMNQ